LERDMIAASADPDSMAIAMPVASAEI